jgi:hypothetical protein
VRLEDWLDIASEVDWWRDCSLLTSKGDAASNGGDQRRRGEATRIRQQAVTLGHPVATVAPVSAFFNISCSLYELVCSICSERRRELR